MKKYFLIGLGLMLLTMGLPSCTKWLIEDDGSPRDIFQMFWDQIDRYYVNFAEHPVDWDSIYVLYMPKVEEMQCDTELLPVFQDIVNAIGDGHISVSHHSDLISYHIQNPYPYQVDYGGDIFVTRASSEYQLSDRDDSYTENSCFYSMDILHRTDNHESRIAYIRVMSFQHNGNETCYRDALQNLMQRNPIGCIVDLRGNKGGSIYHMFELVRQFYSGDSCIFHSCSRASVKDRLAMTPLEPIEVIGESTIPMAMPVIVLVNGETYSAANICSYVLGKLPNVSVVGVSSTSGGGASPSCVALPHQWVLCFPNSIKLLKDGQSCELPYQPNVVVDTSNVYEEIIEKDNRTLTLTHVGAAIVTAIKLIE